MCNVLYVMKRWGMIIIMHFLLVHRFNLIWTIAILHPVLHNTGCMELLIQLICFDIYRHEDSDVAGWVAMLIYVVFGIIEMIRCEIIIVWTQRNWAITRLIRGMIGMMFINNKSCGNRVVLRWKHCSIDVCFFVANDVISFACCFSNSNDDFVQVQTRCKVINVTMLEGEGLTMLYVIQLAMQHEWNFVVFESDSQTW
jgi:hypothetical protein